MNYYALIQLINATLFFTMGLFVYIRDRKSLLHKIFFVFCLSVSTWTFCYMIWLLYSTNHEKGLFWVRALHVGAVFIPSTYLHHLLIYLGMHKDKLKKLVIIGGYCLSIFFLAISYTPLFIKNVEQKLFFPYWPVPGVFYHVFIIYIYGYAIYSWVLMLSKFHGSPHEEKERIKYILIASILAYIGGGTNFFLHYNIPIPPLGDFLLTLYPILIAYVILRHKLFGIDIIIQRGLVYSALAGFITAIFFASMLIIEKFFQGLAGYQALFITVGVGFLLAFGFNPLKDVFQRFVDRRFFCGTLEEIAIENEHLRKEMLKQDRMKAVATLAASMAHEIKNPLTVIKTFTEFLPDKHNDENFVNKFSHLVKPQVEKINFTVQQLLNFSKPTAPDLKPVNICQILRETAELLNNDFLKNRIRPQVTFSADDMMILGDADQLKQVFLNLFLNSIDAMPHGGSIIISGRLEDDNKGRFVEIQIQDNGCGISEENLDRIFQPFFTTKSNGTGLGLSVVHDILQQHSASIKAESEDGKWTRFIIHFLTSG